jgi:transcription initiation factor IIE alpha subunit
MDFNRVAKMINKGEHLTKEGLAEILNIKSNMNQ